MSFASPSYLFFLAPVYLAFYLAPGRFQWVFLLAASYVFYASLGAPHLLITLALVTLASYTCALGLGRAGTGRIRSLIFWSGTVACVLALTLVRHVIPGFSSPENSLRFENLAATVGVSYFIFQAISYLIDVYLEILKPEWHLGFYALYLAFFPKLPQGPIERAGELLPQLKNSYTFDYGGARSGLLLFALGWFKKSVVADRLAVAVNLVYGDVHSYTGLQLVLATYAYAFQILFDFSGYTDMARGAARLFGIQLTENFNHPYLATSIAEFWRRWHISFSRWIFSYLFRPLQIVWRDLGRAGIALALVATFLVSGIWHGVSWGFIIWGLLHGIYLSASVFWRPLQIKIYEGLGIRNGTLLKAWKVAITFNLVCLAWIFFRASSFQDAWYILTHLFTFAGGRPEVFLECAGSRSLVLVALACAAFFAAAVRPSIAGGFLRAFEGNYRWFLYFAFVLLILVCGVFGKAGFIYGRF